MRFHRRTLALMAIATTALAIPATALAGGGNPSLKFSPSKATKSHGVAKVTVSGTSWGDPTLEICPNQITLSAISTSGQASLLNPVAVSATQSKFSKRINVRLPKGSYNVTAIRACTESEDGSAASLTATAKLTIK
jgi:hypothetical protein